ncbi:aldo/keto reductase [Alginatibacterium sediminis]|uniref:Aldo/keto reductase n=1 Tax=Alginatibacterium sediminis TaxID=2164068 RepID=A0A420EBJ9_9ALTE|nr:aldo/keto reductase [Alginatibacterium sediminis]RKF18034.1 aldo/keto reductase [Alginatibacterium sediminis]
MQYRTLGRSGYRVSEIGLGCWQLGNDFGSLEQDQAQAILDMSQQQAVNFLDTADVYGGGLSEQRIGGWLKTQPKQPYVVTKVGRDGALFPDGYTKAKVAKSLNDSAQRLGVDCIDLAQLHCVPRDILFDGELLSWMEDFQKEGLIHHFGASVEMIDEAVFCAEQPKLSSIQIIFNIFRQDAVEQLFPKAQENNVGIIVRLPLASGLLSGKASSQRVYADNDHRNYNKDGAAFHVGETFNGIPFAKGLELVEALKGYLPTGMTMQQLALRWILDHRAVSSVIAGASSAQQLQANALCSELPPLPSELHEQLSQFYFSEVRQHIRGGI